MKPACSAAKIRGRTAFVMEKILIGRFGALLQQSVMGKIDRSTYIQLIDFGKNLIDRLLSSIDRLFGTSEFPSIST
jgi:hypothetical protein